MPIAVLSGLVMALSLPLSAGAFTTVTAEMTDAIVGGGPAIPGATIEYTVIITDDGNAEAALGVIFSIPTLALDTNTTPVPMSIIAYPIAVDDDYTLSATSDITTEIPDTIGLLANDVDPDGGGTTGACSDMPGTKCLVVEVSSSMSAAMTTPVTITTNQGGSVTVAVDGSFTYESSPGFTGTDGFTYLVEDAAGNSDEVMPFETSVGTVSINVATAVWYVDNDAGGTNVGSLSNPFNTATALQDAAAASTAGDLIFVFQGNTVYAGGIALQNDQMLIGEGEGLTIAFNDSLPGMTDIVIAAGTSPVVTNGGGNGINLADSNTVRGLDIANTGGMAIHGVDAGTLIISKVGISGNGGGFEITNSAAMNVTFTNLSSSDAGDEGISLTGATGTFAVTATDGTITNTAGAGIVIDGSNSLDIGTLTFKSVTATGGVNGIKLKDISAGSFTVTGDGTMDGSGGTITGAGTMDAGIDIDNANNITLKNMDLTNANQVDGGGSCTGSVFTSCNGAIILKDVIDIEIVNLDLDGSAEHGIFGTNVTGFDISESTIDGAGNGANENGIFIINLHGTGATANSVTNTTVTGAAGTTHVMHVRNTTTTGSPTARPDTTSTRSPSRKPSSTSRRAATPSTATYTVSPRLSSDSAERGITSTSGRESVSRKTRANSALGTSSSAKTTATSPEVMYASARYTKLKFSRNWNSPSSPANRHPRASSRNDSPRTAA